MHLPFISGPPSTPHAKLFAVIPHDSEEIGVLPRAIYVGTGGTLALRGPQRR